MPTIHEQGQKAIEELFQNVAISNSRATLYLCCATCRIQGSGDGFIYTESGNRRTPTEMISFILMNNCWLDEDATEMIFSIHTATASHHLVQLKVERILPSKAMQVVSSDITYRSWNRVGS